MFGLILRSGYCPCGVSRVLLVSVWVSFRFSPVSSHGGKWMSKIKGMSECANVSRDLAVCRLGYAGPFGAVMVQELISTRYTSCTLLKGFFY